MFYSWISKRVFGFFSASVVFLAALFYIGLLDLRDNNFTEKISNLGNPQPTNSLSGRVGIDGPILVVKIDDTPLAHPQAGLEAADIIYIEQVEGGLTRLAAVFSSLIPKVIGPVRSARISDIDLLQQFGRVAFAYSGAQSKLLPVIAAANLENLGAQRQSREIYADDPMRNAPYSMMLQAQTLMSKVSEQKLPVAISKQIGWKFGSGPDTGTAITSAEIFWPANSYQVEWSINQKRWLLAHKGIPNFAANGEQLSASTFVIQLVSITPSEYSDKVGGVTPFSETIGSGRGYILRDGKAISAEWSRSDGESGTLWKTLTGEEIAFAPGQIWIALTDKEPKFTPIKVSSIADAPSTTTK